MTAAAPSRGGSTAALVAPAAPQEASVMPPTGAATLFGMVVAGVQFYACKAREAARIRRFDTECGAAPASPSEPGDTARTRCPARFAFYAR